MLGKQTLPTLGTNRVDWSGVTKTSFANSVCVYNDSFTTPGAYPIYGTYGVLIGIKNVCLIAVTYSGIYYSEGSALDLTLVANKAS